jgi:bifunctional non-homologous end joining protein LigD
MLCHTADRLPGAGWAMEPKLDGWRFLFHNRADGRVESFAGRNGANRTGEAPEIELWISLLPLDTIVDAELVAVGEGMISSDVASALARRQPGTLVCYLFDVIRLAGRDVRHLPYSERRRLLESLDLGDGPVRLNLSTEPDQRVFEAWLNVGLEGVVCKRVDSAYRSGKRSRDWCKLKPQKSIDCKIVELPLDGQGKFSGLVGAVVFEIGNGKRGRASGMTDAVRRDMSENPGAYIGRLAEFAYQLQTKGGALRHPQYVRLREDLEAA